MAYAPWEESPIKTLVMGKTSSKISTMRSKSLPKSFPSTCPGRRMSRGSHCQSSSWEAMTTNIRDLVSTRDGEALITEKEHLVIKMTLK